MHWSAEMFVAKEAGFCFFDHQHYMRPFMLKKEKTLLLKQTFIGELSFSEASPTWWLTKV